MRSKLLFLLFIAICAFLIGCKKSTEPKVEWAIRFTDGTEVTIEHPKYVSIGYKCGSGEYEAPSSVSEQVALINKYMKVQGYAVRVDGRLTIVPICQVLE